MLSTILLTLPGTKLPKEDWLDKIWFDKWVHIGMFAVMTWLWCWGIIRRSKKIFYVIAVVCLLYGIIMEFVQHWMIDNRSFDGGDIIADAAGCMIGLLFSLRRYIKNRPL
jgi:VanZ family protein